MPGSVFVTVGTTKFDALIAAVDSVAVAEALLAKGYTELIMQVGKGSYTPKVLCPAGSTSHTHAGGLLVTWFEFMPSLKTYMESASLVISHAGSGSLFEGLALRKAIVAVPNPVLMANHQAELADKLTADRHLVASTTEDLLKTLQELDTSKLVPYTPGDPRVLAGAVDKLMRFAPH